MSIPNVIHQGPRHRLYVSADDPGHVYLTITRPKFTAKPSAVAVSVGIPIEVWRAIQQCNPDPAAWADIGEEEPEPEAEADPARPVRPAPVPVSVMVELPALMERGEGGSVTVTVPALPGCVSGGATAEEALENIREAAEGWLLARQDAELGPPRRVEHGPHTHADRMDDGPDLDPGPGGYATGWGSFS